MESGMTRFGWKYCCYSNRTKSYLKFEISTQQKHFLAIKLAIRLFCCAIAGRVMINCEYRKTRLAYHNNDKLSLFHAATVSCVAVSRTNLFGLNNRYHTKIDISVNCLRAHRLRQRSHQQETNSIARRRLHFRYLAPQRR
jgi:hypothetical protein